MECAAWSSVKIITMFGRRWPLLLDMRGARFCEMAIRRDGSVGRRVVECIGRDGQEGGPTLTLVLHQQAEPGLGGLQPGDEAGDHVAAALCAEQLDLLQPSA